MHVLFCHNDIFHRNLLVIHFMLNRLTPLVGSLLARHFNCQMREPAVRCSSMPMFHFCQNIDAVARFHLYRFFSFFLIITASCHADKDLSATAFCVMDVPVIAALNWTPYSQSLVVTGFNGIHVCALCELFVTSSFARLFLCFVLVPNLFCKVEHCPAFWPACIECYVGDNRCDFFLRYPMILGIL